MPKTIEHVVDFAQHPVAAEPGVVAPERLLGSSAITTATWNHYTDPSGQFFAGIWSGSPGAMRIDYTEEELCVILDGRVRIADLNGQWKEFGPGSAFTIPAGFQGTWETLEPVRKIYAIWQAP